MLKALSVGLIKRYTQHGVSKSCAALTYYTLFSFFPFMLLLGRILGMLSISDAAFITSVSNVIPVEVINIARRYLSAPSASQNTWSTILWSVVTLHLFVRNIRMILPALEEAFGVVNDRPAAVRFILSVALAIGNILLIAAMLLLITLSKNMLSWLSTKMAISAVFISVWDKGRFLFLAALVFLVLFALYAAAVGRSFKWRQLLPGALCATLAWVAISMGFSFYVSHMGRYSVVYGSLGAVIVLLLWLYLSATIIIMGAECCSVVLEQKQRL